jgi:putative flippase GtrA
MIYRQYLKFFINGGVLGVVSWGLQIVIYRGIGIDSGLAYAAATALTYVPLVVINFIIQRHWIFKRDGLFLRFVAANLTIMLLVTLFSPLCRLLITWAVGAEWGDRGGFALAAIAMSVPSFFLKRLFVFNSR